MTVDGHGSDDDHGDMTTAAATVTRPAGNRRPKSLILDVYGRYSPQFKGWIAVSDLVDLMALLDVDEQAVRSAVSRMTRRGLLRPELRGKVRGYRTTPEADGLLADGDRRIYESVQPAKLADGWLLVSFSMPESDRDKRHVLRSKLMWHGMGNVSSGLWIGPARILDDVTASLKSEGFAEYADVFVASYAGLGDVSELVRRSWDLDALRVSYVEFIAAHRPTLRELRRRKKPVDGAEAFALYTRALHQWRKFPYLDPGLPIELLPDDWPGREAAELFVELREQLEAAAFAFAESVASR